MLNFKIEKRYFLFFLIRKYGNVKFRKVKQWYVTKYSLAKAE